MAVEAEPIVEVAPDPTFCKSTQRYCAGRVALVEVARVAGAEMTEALSDLAGMYDGVKEFGVADEAAVERAVTQAGDRIKLAYDLLSVGSFCGAGCVAQARLDEVSVRFPEVG